MRDTIDIYESFLQRALRATLHSPALIVISILVASVNTGSVLFHLYQFATILAPLNKLSVDVFQTLPAVAWIGTSNLFTQSSFGAIAITVLLSVALFLLGVAAQQYLIEQLHPRKKGAKRKSRSLLRATWLHLLFVNALYYLGLLALFLGGSSLLASIPQTVPFAYSFGTMLLYVILILLAFCWNALTLLSLMHIVHEGSSVHDALQASFNHLVKQPINVFELSVLQLIVEILLGFVFVAVVGVGALGASLLTTLLSATSSPFALQSGLIFIGTAIGLSLLLFAGLITSFGYHLWGLYHDEQHALSIKPVLIHFALGVKSIFTRT